MHEKKHEKKRQKSHEIEKLEDKSRAAKKTVKEMKQKIGTRQHEHDSQPSLTTQQVEIQRQMQISHPAAFPKLLWQKKKWLKMFLPPVLLVLKF